MSCAWLAALNFCMPADSTQEEGDVVFKGTSMVLSVAFPPSVMNHLGCLKCLLQ